MERDIKCIKKFDIVIEKMTPMPWNGNGILIIYRYWYGNGIEIRKLTGNETVLGFMKHFSIPIKNKL